MSRFKRFLRGSRGANAVEFALVAPLFFLLVFGMIDFGLIFSDWLVLTNGVREGARVGVVTEGNLTPKSAAVIAKVNDYTSVFGALDSGYPQVTCSDGTTCESAESSLTVRAVRTRSLITPLGNFIAWFGGSMNNSIPLSSTSVMRNE